MQTEILVTAIQTCSSKREPMVPRTSVVLVADRGIDDDRYANGTGAFSKSRRTNVPLELNQRREIIRDVSFITKQAIVASNVARSNLYPERAGEDSFAFADTRRNFEVDYSGDIRELIGVFFAYGDVVFLGIEPCDPCDRPSAISGKPGFQECFAGRGGLRARVVEGGILSINNVLRVIPFAEA